MTNPSIAIATPAIVNTTEGDPCVQLYIEGVGFFIAFGLADEHLQKFAGPKGAQDRFVFIEGPANDLSLFPTGKMGLNVRASRVIGIGDTFNYVQPNVQIVSEDEGGPIDGDNDNVQ